MAKRSHICGNSARYTPTRHATLRGIFDKVVVPQKNVLDVVRRGLVDWRRDANGRMIGEGIPYLLPVGVEKLTEWDAASCTKSAPPQARTYLTETDIRRIVREELSKDGK